MREVIRLGARLLLFTLAAGLLLAATNQITKGPIAAQTGRIEQNARKTVLSEAVDFEKLELTALRDYPNVDEIYRGYDGDVTVGYTFSLSPMGFGAEIKMTLGVNSVGAITGLTVNSQQETANLGTRVAEDAYLNQFLGLAADAEKLNGSVDAVSGATVSSRAVTGAVKEALTLVQSELDIRGKADRALAENRALTKDDVRRAQMIAGGHGIREITPYGALGMDAIQAVYEVDVKGKSNYVFDMMASGDTEDICFTVAIGADGKLAGVTVERPEEITYRDALRQFTKKRADKGLRDVIDGVPEELMDGVIQAAVFYDEYLVKRGG